MRGVYTDVGASLIMVGAVAGAHWKAHPAWGAFIGSGLGSLLAFALGQAAFGGTAAAAS